MIRVVHLPPDLKARLDAEEFVETRPGNRKRWITTAEGVKIEELRFHCADCRRVDPLLFCVRTDLWKTHGIEGILCWQCFEIRLGRPLTEQDLIPDNDKLKRLLVERAEDNLRKLED